MRVSTYIIRLVLLLLVVNACSNNIHKTRTTKVDVNGFRFIFNGLNLEGWKGDTTYWQVRKGGILEGEVTEATRLKQNSFIIYTKEQPENFELKLDYKVSRLGNSGVNYRSEIIEGRPFALRGYQADIDGKKRFVGQNYEEKRRTTLAYVGEEVEIPEMPKQIPLDNIRLNVEKNRWKTRIVNKKSGDLKTLKSHVKDTSWNSMHIIAKGNRLQHYVNGVLMSDVTDFDTSNKRLKGYIGVQVHKGPPMKIQYKNIRLKHL